MTLGKSMHRLRLDTFPNRSEGFAASERGEVLRAHWLDSRRLTPVFRCPLLSTREKRFEGIQVHRLVEVGGKAERHLLFAPQVPRVSTESDDPDVATAGPLPHELGQIVPIHTGHADVDEHDVGNQTRPAS